MKIIIILPYSSLVTDDFKVDIFADGYHTRIAKQIRKISEQYDIECWRPEWKLKEQITDEKDGIVYRAFPSWRPSLGKFTKLVYKNIVKMYAPLRYSLWREYSIPLLKELNKEIKKGDVLVHLYQMHFDLSYLICLLIGNKIPLVGRDIGGTPYRYNIISTITNLPLSLLEKKALSNIDAMIVGTELHAKSFEKFYNVIPEIVYPMPECVDFDLFKPIDKIEARKELGIEPDKKVIIHVGRFDIIKGFDTIIEIMPELKRKYDVEVYGIGGTKNDALYQQAIDAGVKTLEWIPQEELVKWYSASDVYLFPKFYDSKIEEGSEKFMGAGVACAEALGCGLPIVGTNLKGFYATPEELDSIGMIPKDRDDLMKCIEKVFDNPDRFNRCREVAMKYYSWKPTVDRLLKVFNKLEKKYYGNK